jgi:hypothetical protein
MRDIFGKRLIHYNLWLQLTLFLIGLTIILNGRVIAAFLAIDVEWLYGAGVILVIQFGLTRKTTRNRAERQ